MVLIKDLGTSTNQSLFCPFNNGYRQLGQKSKLLSNRLPPCTMTYIYILGHICKYVKENLAYIEKKIMQFKRR